MRDHPMAESAQPTCSNGKRDPTAPPLLALARQWTEGCGSLVNKKEEIQKQRS